jgi:hypothetical protein
VNIEGYHEALKHYVSRANKYSSVMTWFEKRVLINVNATSCDGERRRFSGRKENGYTPFYAIFQ